MATNGSQLSLKTAQSGLAAGEMMMVMMQAGQSEGKRSHGGEILAYV
jgi:hypothetical protein